jgi:hypothetical protein
MIINLFSTLMFSLVLFVLAGCDSTKSALGLDHYQPDEFLVPTNPPLELPPNYNLRPPRTGEPNNGVDPATQAQKAIGVNKVEKSSTATGSNTAEENLIKQASKDVAVDPNIREKLEKLDSKPKDK